MCISLKEKILIAVTQTHNGKLNDSLYHLRVRGSGLYAEQMNQRDKKFRQKYFKETKNTCLIYLVFTKAVINSYGFFNLFLDFI
jgi:hypothetical protein